MFPVKYLIFLMVAFGIMQGFFSLTEGALQPGFTSEDLDTMYHTHIVTITEGGQRISVPDLSVKEEESNWVQTVYRTLSWNRYAVLDVGLGVYFKQFLLWPLSYAMSIGFVLMLVSHIPIIGRGS